jgi:hypothetical protein
MAIPLVSCCCRRCRCPLTIMANTVQPKSARAQPKTQGCSPSAALGAESPLHAAAAANTAAKLLPLMLLPASLASSHRRWHNDAVESVVVVVVPANVAVVVAADVLPSQLHAVAAANTAAAAAATEAAAADAATCKFGLGLPSGHRQWHDDALESVVVIVPTTAAQATRAQPKARGRSPSLQGHSPTRTAPLCCAIATITATAMLPTLPVSAAHCCCAIAIAIAAPLLPPLPLPRDVPKLLPLPLPPWHTYCKGAAQATRAQPHEGAAQVCKGASQAMHSCLLIVVFTVERCPYLRCDV